MVEHSGFLGSSRASRRTCAAARKAPAALQACLIAAFGCLAVTVCSSSGFAQSGQNSSAQSFDLFSGDSVDPDPQAASALTEAARQAQAPGQCPMGSLSIITPEGDPLFQVSLAAARRQAVLQILNNAGIDTSRFFVDSFVGGTTNQSQLTTDLDRASPTLTTNSVPTNGSKVEAGGTIVVTMVARDDKEPKAWQTGIKTIQLVADSDAGSLLASENYEACADADERRVEITYTVPDNPPPIVRLSALAEDHAGQMDTDAAAFPTGDWYGTFNWVHDCRGWMNDKSRGAADLALDYDGRGNLTGTLMGRIAERVQIVPECTITFLDYGSFSARLTGSYTPEPQTFFAQAVDGQTTPGKISSTCPGGTAEADVPFYTVYEGPMFRESFRDLRRQPDGSLKTSGERIFAPSGMTCTTSYELTLKPAQN